MRRTLDRSDNNCSGGIRFDRNAFDVPDWIAKHVARRKEVKVEMRQIVVLKIISHVFKITNSHKQVEEIDRDEIDIEENRSKPQSHDENLVQPVVTASEESILHPQCQQCDDHISWFPERLQMARREKERLGNSRVDRRHDEKQGQERESWKGRGAHHPQKQCQRQSSFRFSPSILWTT
jgi:hypothetical protein